MFKLTESGLIVEGSPTKEEWETCGQQLREKLNGVKWAVGDWLLHGEGRSEWGRIYEDAERIFGEPRNTLAQWKRTAKAYEPCNRLHNLPWTHHHAALTADKSDRKELLEKAAAHGWSKRDVVREAKRLKLPLPIPSDWAHGTTSVRQGDCLDVMKGMGDKCFSHIVTSPPYNMGISYSTYQDNLSEDGYLSWLEQVLGELHRVFEDYGSLFLNVASAPSNPMLSFKVAELAAKLFRVQNVIVWTKGMVIDGTWQGPLRTITSDQYLCHAHEFVFHLTKNEVGLDKMALGVPYADQRNCERYTQPDGVRCAGDVWFIPHQSTDYVSHPATFPVELPLRCLKLTSCSPCSHVLDPFAGTGTTLVAAQQLGAAATGIELDGGYCGIIADRLKKVEATQTTRAV